MQILIDAMGGDKAPDEIVKGCIDAIKESDEFDLVLIGDSEKIKSILDENKCNSSRIRILHSDEVITNEDIPTKAIKTKKDSSMMIGLKMLKEKEGDVFISAGNTGALLTGALLVLGRMTGVDRPALAPVLPTKNGRTMLLDAGLNVVCKPINYLQFGIIGSIYMKEIFHIENPKVGLINVGAEETKGNETIKQAYAKLANSGINFVGNVEGRQIPMGDVDVAVCDGFIGNVLLKFIEGIGLFIYDGLKNVFYKNIISKFSALVVSKELKAFKKTLDYEEYGGTPILGVNGIVFKCHGSSNAKSVKNAIIKAVQFTRSSVMEQIAREFKGMEVENGDE